jgi:hypothetical protein
VERDGHRAGPTPPGKEWRPPEASVAWPSATAAAKRTQPETQAVQFSSDIKPSAGAEELTNVRRQQSPGRNRLARTPAGVKEQGMCPQVLPGTLGDPVVSASNGRTGPSAIQTPGLSKLTSHLGGSGVMASTRRQRCRRGTAALGQPRADGRAQGVRASEGTDEVGEGAPADPAEGSGCQIMELLE